MIKIRNKYLYWVVVITLFVIANPITILALFLYGASQGM